MAIFAQRTRKTNSYLPEFKLTSTLADGQVFVWDEDVGAFVNKPADDVFDGGGGDPGPIDPNLANYVNGGVNLSSNNPIFKQKNNQKLEFRGLIAGGGITLNNMGNDIRIANTVYETGRWENTGIDIVFDQGGNLEFYRRGYRFFFEPTITYEAPSGDIEIIASNPGQIRSISQNFEALGFYPGQKITLDGTDEQDGEWTIAGINGGTITLTTPFGSNLDAGLQPATIIKASRFQIINSIKFAIYGIDLLSEDLAIGDTIIISGTANNDGTYTISNIVGNQIEINETFSSPFESEYGEIIVNTPEEDLPIGVSITDDGTITAKEGVFDKITTTDLVADNILIGNQTLEEYVDDITADLPSGGFIVGTDDGPITREIEVGPGLTITDADGYDNNPKISVKDFYLNFTGDVTGYEVISELNNATIDMTLELIGSPGQYNLVTVDNKGRVISGTKRNITGGPGITVINGDGTLGDPVIHPNDFTITLVGDVTGQATVVDLNSVTINTNIDSTVSGLPTGQWFNRLQVNDKGWVVALQNQSILGSNGVNIANPDGTTGTPVISVNDFNITVNGDVTGQATVNGLSNTVLNLTLPDLILPGTFNQVTIDTKGRVVSATNVVYDYQDQNDNLDELSAPTFDPGLVSWNGTEYESRQLGSAIDQIDINQVGDTFIFSISDNPIFTGTESITIPYGPTNFRPSVPTSGMVRINTNETAIEAYINGDWRIFEPGGQAPSLELQGGTMAGDINMGGNNISNISTINNININDLNDLVDEIYSTNGIKVTTPSGMVSRTIENGFNNGITVTNGDGIAGNPVITFSIFDFNNAASEPADIDEIIFHDMTDNVTKKTTIDKLFRRPARDYYMAQF